MEDRMRGADLGDAFLFWLADSTGASVDQLYSKFFVKAVMILLRKASSILERSPR